MKMFVANFHLRNVGDYTGPMPWSVYPYGVLLIEPPRISLDPDGCHVSLRLECEPQIGKDMGWIPLEQTAETEGKQT